MSRTVALVPAAGVGSRFGAASPKQYLQLLDKPLMWHTLSALCAVEAIDEVAVVISPTDEWFDLHEWPWDKLSVHRVGGGLRAQTVYQGLQALALAEDDWVLVHDAARCCISEALVQRLLHALEDDPVGGLLALPVADTVKRADADGRARQTMPRQGLWLAQTPQMFRVALLTRALADRLEDDSMTDDAAAVECLGFSPKLVEGDLTNLKITWPKDLLLARAILESQKA